MPRPRRRWSDIRRAGHGTSGLKGITVNTVQPGPIDTDMNPADGEFAAALEAA